MIDHDAHDGLRVLVTGANGFVGRSTVAALAEHPGCASVHPFVRADGDLSTQEGADALERTIRRESIDVVVHLACIVGPAAAAADPAAAVAANAGATLLVARACADAGARLALGSTTDAVRPAGRSNIYALTKAWSEQAAELAAPTGLQVLRLCGPYGPGVRPGGGRSALVNMAWQARNGATIPAWRGVRRRWCHVRDVAAAIAAATIELTPGDGVPDVIDIGRNDAHELSETARMLCRLAGSDPSLVTEVEPPAGVGDGDAPLDLTALDQTSWSPVVGLEAGLTELVDWVSRFATA